MRKNIIWSEPGRAAACSIGRPSMLRRLAAMLVMIVCAAMQTWATDVTYEFVQQSKTNTEHISTDQVIKATFAGEKLAYQKSYVKFNKLTPDDNKIGTLTITADGATIKSVKLLVTQSTKKNDGKEYTADEITGVTAAQGVTSISVSGTTTAAMPVKWNEANTKVIFSCSADKDLYVFGAEVTYENIDDGKIDLDFVSAPVISLVSASTTTDKLTFTIDQTAKTQDGTSLITWYTTDGSNPNDADNAKRAKLTSNPQNIEVSWAKGDVVKVRAFTQRVATEDATNYRDGAEATQDFTNTGSTELASVDMPTLTKDFVTTDNSRTVTLEDAQASQNLTGTLKVYYHKYNEAKDKDVPENEWTEAATLPMTFTLTETTSIKAYAEYKPTSGDAIKSDVVTRAYIMLDADKSYIVPSTTKEMEVANTAKVEGITMTYGGMKVGTSKFKKISKNDKSDANVLGSDHVIESAPLYVDVDVESEAGDGNRGGEYLHTNSGAELHDRTFALPAKGSFFKFEPEANGTLTVFVEQQGAIHNVSGTLHADVVRKRPVYFIDETGQSIPATFAYTSSKVNRGDWEKIQATATSSKDGMYSKDYMDKLEAYYQNIIDGKNTSFINFNSAVADTKKHGKLALGSSIQPIIVLHEASNADILKGDGISETGDTDYDQTGYMLISEGYVCYKFSVKAGKTYFLFASRTKLALSGFSFAKDADYQVAADITLDGNADNTSTIQGLEVGKQYNVTLKNRTFKKDKWYALVLPFSVSQQQMKQAFGEDVMTVHFDGVDGTDLDLFEHFYKMTVGGTPLLVKPSQDVTQDIQFKNVTLTSKEVLPIVKNGFKADGSWNNVDFPDYSYFIDARDNTFYQYNPDKTAEGTVKPHAGAMRAWVIADGNAAQAKQLTMHINGIGDQQDTDGIRSALFGESDAEQTARLTGIYTISGQKLAATSTNGLPKGMYIVNGKKLIVK